jgi:hypothetical protein
VKRKACIVALSQDLVLPLVARDTFHDDVEAVILVPARVVLFEAGQFTDDSSVGEPGLLLYLSKQARLELLARIEPAGRHLNTYVRVLGILEDEQFGTTV